FYQTCFLTKTVSGETPADYTWASASWEGASSLANAQKGVRRYVAGYQDICPEGYEAFKPFPMEINGSSSFDMLTGPLPQGEEVTVILGLDPMKDTGLALSVDGQEAKSVPVPEDAFILTRIGEITDAVQKEKAKTFAVYRGFAYKSTGDGNVRTLTASGKNAVIKYIEIIVGKSED
ncbi:MAG: hypothetical protein MJ078_06025, partial [Clostridia bacterium]|nr:hypothetical protein [Clostridia bacterium]